MGLDLSGAKNQKTVIAALEFYPREKKIFLLDLYDKIAPAVSAAEPSPAGSDEGLLELIDELVENLPSKSVKMGVNVPLVLPPCITCTRKKCPLPDKCTVSAVKWMRQFSEDTDNAHKIFTPYTQRPVELWLRYEVLEKMNTVKGIDVDETLGGNRAPLSARMHFLQRHLQSLDLLEVWPKLSLLLLARHAGVSRRIIQTYRHLEEGLTAREELLDVIAETFQVFVYERDIRKLSQNLAAFDAFICALTALLAAQGLCEKMPAHFPHSSGWIHIPQLSDTDKKGL